MLTLLILFSLAVPVDPPKEKEFSAGDKEELKKFEGRWRVVKFAGLGQESDVKDREVYFTFKGADVTITSGTKVDALRIATIDTTTDPKCIDIIEKRKGRPDRTLEGVYRIDGDTLQFAHELPGDGKSRPPGFGKSAERALVWTMKRVKE